MPLVKDKTAVVGIGQTAFGKGLPDTELSLACQAIALALDDAGIAPSRGRRARVVHDGAATARSTSPAPSGSATSRSSRRSASAAAPAAASSARPRWPSRPGSATIAVAWRARKRADTASRPWAQAAARISDSWQWTRPFGIIRPVDEIAMLTRRYMHEYGGTRDHLANVAIAFRKHAARNPDVDDGSQAADPRRLHERALDLRAAVPVRQLPRDRRRARGRRHVGASAPATSAARPRYIHSFAQGLPPQHQTMTNYFTDDPLRGPAWTAAQRLWANADVTPADVQVAQLYDAFSPLIPLSLEGYGFCERGEGGPFTDDGDIEWPDGRLPVNTAGGGMSEAYVHGFNLVLEGVRQIRGTSTSQVDGRRRLARDERRRRPDVGDPLHEGRC